MIPFQREAAAECPLALGALHLEVAEELYLREMVEGHQVAAEVYGQSGLR